MTLYKSALNAAEMTHRVCVCVCVFVCVHALQVNSSILYLLLSTDATHLQTAAQAARLCC